MDVITFFINLQTTSGLSILLHGIISLPDATSYDNTISLSVQPNRWPTIAETGAFMHLYTQKNN